MTREEILHLPKDELLKLIYDNFAITVPGLEDSRHMSFAWQIVEALVGKGWGIDVRRSPDSITVDGYKFDNGPGTIFAQYGSSPNFSTVVEGICKTALIALLSTGEFQNL